ncbi:YveK family protein [Butyrivibrio sp. WCE2006]|uniref:YveK family protein n=1 Tax=Butyrivibrio sp. WCE2006 TaxID=1410611 RepID=UPI0006791D19|nr:Wzz/FepE/Etk N-terminal domain-containing protein [Butyrivibrio sp. WCE2006]
MEKKQMEQKQIKVLKVDDDQEEMEIDLFGLLNYFRSKLIIIIAAFVLGSVLAGAYTYFLVEPLYTAKAKIYVVSASTDTMVNLTDLNLGTGLSADYEQVITIRPIFNQVIKDLDLDYTYEELVKMVEIAVVKNTRIMTISVTSNDPNEAEQIANDIAKQAEIQIPKLMDTPKPHIIEPAIVPMFKSSPSYSKNIMIGALGATVLVLGIFTVIFVLQDTVNSADDIERMFGILPLAVIPEGNIGILAEGNESTSGKKIKNIKDEKRGKEAKCS